MVAFDGGLQPANGDQYIVNGFPYSGMGFGFNRAAAACRSWRCRRTPRRQVGAPPAAPAIIPGGVNSDYTAPDYQDPLLALGRSESE